MDIAHHYNTWLDELKLDNTSSLPTLYIIRRKLEQDLDNLTTIIEAVDVLIETLEEKKEEKCL